MQIKVSIEFWSVNLVWEIFIFEWVFDQQNRTNIATIKITYVRHVFSSFPSIYQGAVPLLRVRNKTIEASTPTRTDVNIWCFVCWMIYSSKDTPENYRSYGLFSLFFISVDESIIQTYKATDIHVYVNLL